MSDEVHLSVSILRPQVHIEDEHPMFDFAGKILDGGFFWRDK
jgi:hypothetical protein